MNFTFFKPVLLTATLALGVAAANAQNLAIVNGKAVPKARLQALAAQLERAGRAVTPRLCCFRRPTRCRGCSP
jgi:peptidyl-prolyl cis-trans isomerase C